MEKRVPVFTAQFFTGKNLFYFALFIEYFDFMKHDTLHVKADLQCELPRFGGIKLIEAPPPG